MQELTDYGLKYHVQLIPYLDGPAHVAFILKHPEYAKLREYPDSNYELCTTNPDSYKLLEGLYQDLMDANKGVKYFVLSTDESYYVGMADNAQCNEGQLAKKLGSVGKVEAQFLDKAAGYLHEHGRTVVFWGEYPLVPGDIPSLPSYLVNGEVYGPEFDRAFKAHGIKQMIFVSSTVGSGAPISPPTMSRRRQQLFNPIRIGDRLGRDLPAHSFDSARKNADLIGVCRRLGRSKGCIRKRSGWDTQPGRAGAGIRARPIRLWLGITFITFSTARAARMSAGSTN